MEKSDRNGVVYRTLNWAEEIGVVAGPLQPNDTRESWLARAARKAGLSYRQCKSLFYGQTKDPRHSVASKLLSAADRARIEEARRDAAKLAGVYQSAAHALGNIDENFHRGNIDALVNAARILGSLDSAGTKGVKS